MTDKDPTTNTASKPGEISLEIKDDHELYMAYMPFISGGALFVPGAKDYSLGDVVNLLLKLPDNPDELSIAGEVIWITPVGAEGNRQQGTGIQFTGGNKIQVRRLIETRLGKQLTSKKATHTM